MLNRRSLRVKVMQSLFAFHQSMEAAHLLSQDYIEETFMPDLNSLEVQDKKELNKKKKEALKLFASAFDEGKEVAHEDPAVAAAVRKAIELYHAAEKKDFEFFRKRLVADVEKIYAHYLSVLTLAVALAEAAEEDKKIDHSNFLKNSWLMALRQSIAVKKEIAQANSSWSKRRDRVKLWLRDVVRQDGEYMNYLDKKSPSEEAQRKLMIHLFRKVILGNTVINDYFEEEVLHWAEDRDIIKGMVEKTVKAYTPGQGEDLQLHSLSLNWEDDKDFIGRLFSGSARLIPEHQELIAENTRNWDVDRLPLTDRVILAMAITEMVSFPNIPVKVTINEYIELAKNYSTPKSRQFINGILDVISKELKAKGSLKKTGRGLLDNK